MNREELLKNAKPILFNTEMVKAILDGRKTVTRRVVKPQPWDCSDIGCKEHKISNFFKDEPYEFACEICGCGVGREGHSLFKSYVKVGDILYVRETWQCINPYSDKEYVYKAGCDEDYASDIGNWIPSILMPKEVARIFLKVTDVRVERLKVITPEQIEREGTAIPNGFCYEDLFANLWNSTIKKQDIDKYGWNVNPYVWVIEFERVEVDGKDYL